MTVVYAAVASGHAALLLGCFHRHSRVSSLKIQATRTRKNLTELINPPAGRVANDQAVVLQEAFGLSLLVYALGHGPLFNVYTIIKADLLSKLPPHHHPCPCFPPSVHWSARFLTSDFKYLHRAP